ncbi:MAG TPA: cupin domain-containing protein [Pyrinomonadaceae bacterium]|jgi:hypothetical protein
MKGLGFNQLEKLLQPCPAEEFLASSWGQSFRHVRGSAGRFAPLLPWERLNTILEQHRLDFPRLRLVRDGKPLPASSYIRHVSNRRRKETIPRLLPEGFTKQLWQGATLVLDAVDELYQPLKELAQGLELFFREHVQINSYAGWHTSRGFDLHWDDHDVFILQVAGRKRWMIYGMTRPFPLAEEKEAARKPEHQAIWDGTLEDGDLLYIPRGWWHVAVPLNEPTLHLTVGIHNRTGMDLLRWLTERMPASQAFRQDLPRFASERERAAHLKRLREELLNEWTDELLELYLDDCDAKAEPRTSFNLPWSAMTEALPPTGDALLSLNAPRPLDFKIEGGVLEFACLKKRWRFAADARLVLGPLAERRICSLKELCEEASQRLDEQTVRTFIKELIAQGLVAVVTE